MHDKFLFIKESDHSFIMFVPADMSSVKKFRQELNKSLQLHHFPEEDIFQIELACDEALTNSISANVQHQCQETIICRWRIEGFKFSLIILDYGRGFLPEKTLKKEYPKNLNELVTNFKKLQEECSRILPYDGVQKPHKNMGQGFKIITKLMDTVKILYHAEDNILEDPTITDRIEGSILELEFYCKKK